jgi:hypothetical protein
MKKMIILVLVISSLISKSFAQSNAPKPTVFPDSSYLKKYYFGFLYTGSGKKYYDIQSILNIRLGVAVAVPLFGFGTLSTQAFIDPLEKENKLKAEGRLTIPIADALVVSGGIIPTDTRKSQTPSPISPEGQFLPGAKAVISPGFHPGIEISNKNLCLGAYADGEDKFQYHLGYKTENIGPIKSLKLSAFILGGRAVSDTLSGGGVLTINLTGISFTAYSEKMTSINTYSFFTKVNVSESLESYASLVYKNRSWQSAEVGVLQSASQNLGLLTVKYCYGLGYQYYPYKAINFYLQTWLN